MHTYQYIHTAKLTRDGVIIAQLCARGEKEQGALRRQLRLFATTAACIHPCRPRSNTGNPLPNEIWQGAGWAIHLVGEICKSLTWLAQR